MGDRCHVRLVLRVVDPVVASAVQRCHEKIFVGIVRMPEHGDLERCEFLPIPGIGVQGAFVSRMVPHTIRQDAIWLQLMLFCHSVAPYQYVCVQARITSSLASLYSLSGICRCRVGMSARM